jgi:predicted dehydrogenase
VTKRVRIGILGCGYWAPNLIRNFQKLRECEVVAAADLDPARLDALRLTYPQIETTVDPDAVLSRADIDAIAVVTPISTHYPLARSALDGGKHVLVEKPLAETTEQAGELVALAERRERVLMVDHTFVYTGAVRKIRDLITSGELGTILYLDSVRINLGLVQRDANVLWDLAPHDFAIMDHLFDAPLERVSAVGACPIEVDGTRLESVAYVTIQVGGGSLAHFHLSWISPLKIRRMLIVGNRKMVVYDHLDPDNQVKVYDKGYDIRTVEERERVLIQRRTGDMYAPKVDQTEALEHLCRHFVECIVHQRRPITDGRAGARVVQLLEAAQRSMARGGASVSL